MATYAQTTTVSSEASKSEIERTLRRYGAASFLSGWDQQRAVIGFVVNERQVRFVLPMPDPNERRFTHTPGRGQPRDKPARDREYEQAVRQSWRALALVIKAKLEAVEAGIVDYETEFGMHMVLPDGRTAAEHVLPALKAAYATGTVPVLMPDWSRPALPPGQSK